MSRFLETAQYLRDLNALWDQHAVHIAKANTNLKDMLNTASKLPSTYISNLRKITEAQDRLTASTSRLTAETTRQSNEINNLINRKNALLLANKSLSRAIDELEAKLKKATAALADMKSKSDAAALAQEKARQKMAETERQVASLTARLNQSAIAVDRLSFGMNATRNLMSAFGISFGLFLAADIVKNIYRTTKELQSLDLALKMVSGDAETFAENSVFVKGLAEKWGIEVKGLTQQYTQFYTASKGILSLEKIKTVFEGIAKSGALMGLSVEKQNSAFYAFEQMMSKGVVSSEELKKQLGNAMPGAMKAAGMAYMDLHPKIKSIQEAEGALLKEMKAGAIDSATYVPLIVKNFEKLYGIEMVTKVETMQAAQERLGNTWTEMVRAMSVADQGTVAGQTLIGMTRLANGLLEVLTEIVSTQKQINAGNKDQGTIKAEGTVASDIENYGGKTDKEKLAFAYKLKAEDYAEAVAASQKIASLKKEMEDSIIPKQFQWSLKAQLASAYESLGYFNARVQAAKRYINPEVIVGAADIDGESDKEKRAREKREREAARLRAKEAKDAYGAGLSELNKEKFIIEQKALLKENNYSENLRLAMDLSVKEQEIAKYVYDEEVRLAGSSKDKKIIADNKYYQEREKLAKAALERISKVEAGQDFNKLKDTGKVADVETYGSGVFETDPSRIKGMVDKWKEQQDEKDKIAKKEKERLLAMRDVLNDVFKEFGKATGFEKTMDIFAKIGKNGKTFWENLTGGKEGQIDLKEALTAGLTITQDIGNKIAQGNQERYEAQRDRLSAQKDEAIKNAGDSATAKAAIEIEYEKKSKEIDRREAVAKKKQAMFNIALDTAQALIRLWVNPGFPAAIPMSIVVGALGIAQMAIVGSKPIPSYYTGTDNAPEGYANTDEQGAELHLDKNGKIKDFGSNKGPRIKYLDKGDKILPAGKTAKILSGTDFASLDEILSLNNISYHDNKVNQLDSSGIISSIESLKHTILNKETSEEVYDIRGWTKYTKINGQRIEDKNNRIRFKKSIT